MKICFHTHCFPDPLAPRAMEVLKANAAPFGIFARTDGTAAGAKKRLRAAGIDGALVCNIATNPRQESKVNDFAIALAREKDFLFAAGSLHPESEQVASELDRLQKAGRKGINIHPADVGIAITDERFERIFSQAEERGMFVVSHTGFDPVSPDRVHATPEGLLQVKRRHPKLKLIAAHMGGDKQSGEVLRLLAGTDLCFDTSLCSNRADERETLIAILRNHDDKKILFGTDTPWSDPEKEIAFIESAGLSDRAKERIYYQNAAEMLGL